MLVWKFLKVKDPDDIQTAKSKKCANINSRKKVANTEFVSTILTDIDTIITK